MGFPDMLDQWCLDHGMKYVDLSRAAKLSEHLVSQLVNGRRLTARAAIALSKPLRISARTLLIMQVDDDLRKAKEKRMKKELV